MTRPLALALLASTALFPAALHAQELPTGGTVASGSATIGTPSGGAMTITQGSDRAVINWQGFSIGEGGRVDIHQPDSGSALLNRVTGDTSSTIAGQLNANGQVYLVNPNGILITKTGSVNAAGFVASTLDVSDKQFMDGEIVVTGHGGSVSNQGRISIVKGGYAALIGGKVDNAGLIVAPLGRVALASGRRATLDLEGDGFLQVALPASEGGVAMPGRIVADGGAVLLTAGQARDAARATVNLTGVIEARGVEGTSGNVTLTGGDIRLAGAAIDVSGANGGGTVRIGGDREGKGDLAHAETLSVDAATVIRADATHAGNGGDIVLWSDNATDFAGAISARGAGGGKGGEAEVSGKALLGYGGTADLRGATFGTLLLDPYNVTISAGAQTTGSGFTANGNDSVINATTLVGALATANVTVATGSGGSQAGDISVVAPLAWTSGGTLTLNAAGAISLAGGIDAAAGGLTLNAGGAISAAGAVSVARFTLGLGNWVQNSAALPAFRAGDFRIVGGSFLRATGGTGAAASPWALTDIYGVQGMAILRTSHFTLANDVDAAGTAGWNGGAGFSPVGSDGAEFAGRLDGAGHVVSGLTIDRPGQNYVGLIGALGINGGVSRIGIVGSAISGGNYVGGLVGGNYGGAVSNAYATGEVSGDGIVGGLVGSNLGTMSNAYATGAVSGGSGVGGVGGVGGLVGYNRGTVSNAYATGVVSGSSRVGGLVGINRATVSNAYATGAVSGNSNVGGLAGENYGAVSNVYATGAVSGSSAIGGLVGYNFGGGSVSNAYATGVVSGSSRVGGLVGTNYGTVSNAYWDKETTGQSSSSGSAATAGLTTAQARSQGSYAGFDFDTIWYQAGDLRPMLRSEAGAAGADGVYTISNLHQLQLMALNLGASYRLASDIDAGATADIDPAGIFGTGGFVPVGNNYSTAFTGRLEGAGHVVSGLTINRPDMDNVGLIGHLGSGGSVNGIGMIGGAANGKDAVGGLVGLSNGTVSNAYATGAVSGSGNSVGGLVGFSSGTVSNAYATGAVSGWGYIGGLVGHNWGIVSNAYAIGAVSGGGIYIGGLVGYNYGTVSNAYATGAVSAPFGGTGGLVGYNYGGTVSNAYWDKETTGQSSSSGSAATAGLTTAQARSQGGYAGFNFDTIWYQAGDLRPMLRSEAGTAGADGVYTISNLHQLQLMALNLGASYRLASDIDAGATAGTDPAGIFGTGGFVPVGSDSTQFTGSLDGVGHVVSGLIINRPDQDFVGLIGALGFGGSVSRVGMVGGAVSGSSQVGGLVGYNDYGTVSNAYATGAISGGGAHIGGLVGLNDGTVSNAHATGAVSGYAYVGGLVGSNFGGTVSTAYATGAVSGRYDVGGLAGANNGTVSNAYWDVQTAGTSASDGGTGLTTAELQGSLPTGFDPVVWGTGAGLYPYLKSFFPTGVQAISGTATAASGSVAGAQFSLYGGGITLGAGTTSVGANGYYYMILPAGTLDGTSALGATLTLNGAAAASGLAYADGLAPDANGNLSGPGIAAATRAYRTTGSTLSGLVSGAAAAFGSARYAALDAALADTDMSIDASAPGFTVDRSLALGSSDLRLSAAGDLTIAAGASIAGRDLTLAAGGDFINNSGAGALAATGRWLVYLPQTDGNSFGGLDSGNRAVWGTTSGAAVAATGNRYVFAEAAGTLTFTPVDATKTYGDTLTFGATEGTDFTVIGYRQGVAGAYLGDTAATAWSGTPALTSDGAAATAEVRPGGYAISLSGISGMNGYSVDNTSTGTLTVTPRGLTVTADDLARLYGDANPALTWTAAGLVNGDTLSGSLATDAGVTSNVGSYAITQGSLSAGGNYTLAFVDGTLAVTPRSLTITADALSRIYGDANPLTGTATGDNLVNGDIVASVTLATDATAQSNVGSYDLTGADAQGSGLGNYAITYATRANGLTITPRGLTVTADNLARLYGNANPVLTWTAIGLVNGDTLAGSLATDATLTSNVGAYAITQGSLTEAANPNYEITYQAGTLTITPATLTILGATGLDKTYDGTTALRAGETGFTYAGVLFGDEVSVTAASVAYDSPNAGARNVNVTGLEIGGAKSVNYVLSADAVIGSGRIDPATLTYVADSATRAYGSANPVFTGAVTGFVNGEDLAGATTGTLAFTSTAGHGANVGSYAVNGSGLAANHGNYVFVQAGGNATALTVTPAQLTVTGSKVYDRTTGFVVGQLAVAGGVNGETVSLTGGSGSAGSFDVGSYTGSLSGLAIAVAGGNGLASNYQLPASGTLAITPRALVIAADAVSRVYGDANPATGAATGDDLVAGDTITSVTLSSSATAASNVGSYDLTGSNAQGKGLSNYAITYATRANGLTITPRGLTVTADNLARIYGDANPALTWTAAGLVNGDTLAGSLATAATLTSNVGTYAITPGSLAEANPNYAITYRSGTLTITPATLTVVGASGLNKTYDGTMALLAGQTGFTYSGVLFGDDISVTAASVAYDNPNAGVRNVNVTGLEIGGAKSVNYVLSADAVTGSGTIDPATLTYIADRATRSYGSPNPAFGGAVTGFVNGEDLASATTGTLVFSSTAGSGANVGSYAVEGSGLVASNGNYLFAQAGSNATALSVTPALLSVTGSKVYDRTTGFVVGQLAVAGGVNGETVSLAAGTGTASSANAGNYADGTLSGLTLSVAGGNALASNYQLPAMGVLTIGKATLTYTANTANRTYGAANPALAGTVAGFVSGDTLANATTGTLGWNTSATTSSSVGTYDIIGSGLSSANYTFVQAVGNASALSVTPALLTVTGSKVYDRTTGFVVDQLTVAGGVNGETVSLTGGSGSVGSFDVGSYTGSLSGLAIAVAGGNGLASNYQLPATGTLAVTPRALTITADALSRIYGDANPLTGTATSDNLVNGDTVTSVTLATDATERSNVGSYDLTGSDAQGSGLSNYAITYVTTRNGLTISPRSITVTADDLSRLYGEANPPLTYTIGGAGLVNGDTLSGELATTAARTSSPGLYAITQGTLAWTPNYSVTFTPGTLTILPSRTVSASLLGSSVVRDSYAADTALRSSQAVLLHQYEDSGADTSDVPLFASPPEGNPTICPREPACPMAF